MLKRLSIFAAVLALPAIAVIAWMLSPAPRPDTEQAATESMPSPASEAAALHLRSERRASRLPRSVGRKSPAFPAKISPNLASAPAAAPVQPASQAPSISPRYTLTTQPDAATLARRLANHPPLAPDERIRVLPVETAAPRSAEAGSPGSASAGDRPAADTGAVVVKVDATLHDPRRGSKMKGRSTAPGRREGEDRR